MTEGWKTVAESKQAKRESLLPKEWLAPSLKTIDELESHLSKEEIALTNMSGVELTSAMKSGKLKVTTVVKAFCHRATLAQQLTNCLTEILFESAISKAEEMDKNFSTEKSKGLLYGLPISVKDSNDIKGYDSSIGYIAYCNKPAKDNSVFYNSIVEQDGIVIAKTNIPQTMMCADSDNNVWGRVRNPYNSGYTAGGSSGGEGAMIACKGASIGIGTDIAGSIRIPAWCCGTYGLRPGSWRLPLHGNVAPFRTGGPVIDPVIGPLANFPEDIKLMYQAVLETKPWLVDSDTYPLPFRAVDPAPKKLKFAYFSSFGDTVPHPPVLRAIENTVKALKSAGHSVVDVQSEFPQDSVEFRNVCDILLCIDSYAAAFEVIKEGCEPVVEVVKRWGYPDLPVHTAEQVCAAREWLGAFKEKVMACLNKYLPGDYDFLLCPGAASTAVPHDCYLQFDYTLLWNAIDLPAIIIPTQWKVDPSLDKPRPVDKSSGKAEKAQFIEGLWDPEGMKGLPIGVQLVGNKFHEEELIEGSIAVKAALKEFSV